MKPAIRVHQVSKEYRIGAAVEGGYSTLRESLNRAVAAQWRRMRQGKLVSTTGAGRSAERFWALNDVTFDVQPGEVVGIIGRNGAGKSTLLKVLSRITEPTSGRVELRGRVGSLLEVGTGFHPELTGRENIYMNGAMLGMQRREIRRKFDEIVDFAEVEQFLETPVKRYSSGMYVRLAFAVAAYLEPEILFVDEVLAVGDAGFQAKCLGKMSSLANSGRTILFVSHNLGIVSSLCRTTICLNRGSVAYYGTTPDVLRRYQASSTPSQSNRLIEQHERAGNGSIRLVSVNFLDAHQFRTECLLAGNDLRIQLEFDVHRETSNVEVMLWFVDEFGTRTTYLSNRLTGERLSAKPPSGNIACEIPLLCLVPGKYHLDVTLCASGEVADVIYDAANLTVETGPFFPTGKTPLREHGNHLTRHRWHGFPRQNAAACTSVGMDDTTRSSDD